MSNYAKLKTNLKLAIQRLKLAEKKKSKLSSIERIIISKVINKFQRNYLINQEKKLLIIFQSINQIELEYALSI
jgi:hypothetical protein